MINKTLFALFIGFLAILLAVKAPVMADWSIDYQGNLVYSSPQVLGENDETEVAEIDKPEQEREQEREIENETEKEPEREMELEREREMERKQKLERVNGEEPRKIQKPERMEIKKEDIKTIRLRQTEDKKVRLNVETKDEKRLEELQDKFEIDQEGIKLKISSGEGKGEFEIERNGFKAKTKFPLTVDPETKQLSVTTPAGTKEVTILPDKAASVIQGLGIVNSLEDENPVEMTTENNKLVYKVKGRKREKLFGLFEVEVEKEAKMSAESGEYLGTDQSTFSKILDVFSF